VVRQTNKTMHARFSIDQGTSKSTIAGTDYASSGRSARLGVTGDNLNYWFDQAGYTAYQVTLVSGNVRIPDSAVAQDATTAKTNGSWSKINFGLSRQQSIGSGYTLFGAFNGQFADKNLTGGEMMGLGGASGVRAYPWGEAAGSKAYVTNLELRHTRGLDGLSTATNMTLSLFYDVGAGLAYPKPWLANDTGWRMLRGYGAGLSFDSRAYYLRFIAAAHSNNAPSLVEPGSASRVWVQAGYRF
jgi:hemolysin activation/secretion protein